ncbi:MAG: hypothetical protein J6336_13150 [Kiritimatiellae bacterium]|nr:hypothetical protein [Kiritimatiellia bacterium]
MKRWKHSKFPTTRQVDIVMSDLDTVETESSLEIHFQRQDPAHRLAN